MEKLRIFLEEVMRGTENGYAILQIENTVDYQYVMFASLKELKAMGKKPNSEHYELVYTKSIDFVPGNVERLLEYLYQKFNIDIPENFTGHSLSVGDIVAVKDDGKISFWFVDSIGFAKLDDFA